jgi:hypothetical protein
MMHTRHNVIFNVQQNEQKYIYEVVLALIHCLDYLKFFIVFVYYLIFLLFIQLHSWLTTQYLSMIVLAVQ